MTIAPRTRLIRETLDAALDAGDAAVVAAARRLVVADRLGWRRHADAADIRLVWAFAE